MAIRWKMSILKLILLLTPKDKKIFLFNDGNIIIKCDEFHKKEKTNLIILIGYGTR